MPSATTADNSDSIAASSANAIASGSTACIFANENAGSTGAGSVSGMPPKREPMVSTGSPAIATAAVPANHPVDADGHYDATDFDPSWAWAAGGAWSTVSDLALWVPALVEGAMLSSELAAARMEWMPADPANPEAGAYGLGIATQSGLVGHTGAVPGYTSLAGAEPNVGLTIVVLTNLYREPSLGPTPDMRIALAAIGAGLPLLWA